MFVYECEVWVRAVNAKFLQSMDMKSYGDINASVEELEKIMNKQYSFWIDEYFSINSDQDIVKQIMFINDDGSIDYRIYVPNHNLFSDGVKLTQIKYCRYRAKLILNFVKKFNDNNKETIEIKNDHILD